MYQLIIFEGYALPPLLFELVSEPQLELGQIDIWTKAMWRGISSLFSSENAISLSMVPKKKTTSKWINY